MKHRKINLSEYPINRVNGKGLCINLDHIECEFDDTGEKTLNDFIIIHFHGGKLKFPINECTLEADRWIFPSRDSIPRATQYLTIQCSELWEDILFAIAKNN